MPKQMSSIKRFANLLYQDAMYWASYNASDMYQKQQMRNGMQQQIGTPRCTLLDRDVASKAATIAQVIANKLNK